MENHDMASKPLTYKGYSGSIEASVEDGCLHGKLLFINDLITYEGETVPQLIESFHLAVDSYLHYCKSTGKPANKAFSGTFNVRIGPERHVSIAKKAVELGLAGVNEAVCAAIDNWLQPAEPTHNHWHIHVDTPKTMTVASLGEPSYQVIPNVTH
jgi:predicted HicB family RNase H-like nuclease